MPHYFDPENLTPEQQSRWDWAMAEYARVQDMNLNNEIEAMTPDEQQKSLASFRRQSQNKDLGLRDFMKTLRNAMGGQAGNPKSALFARLLEGKPPLPFPPPTSYSYPWYAAIEEPGPFPVMIGGVPTMGGQVNGTRGAVGECAIGINQCAWAVVSMNEPAKQLMDLQEKLSATARPEKEDSCSYVVTWTPELLDAVLAAYEAKPEFIVRHGRSADYRLRIGRGECNARRGYMLDSIARIVERKTDQMTRIGSVYDAHMLNINAVFGEVTSKEEHPRERLRKAQERLAMLVQKNPAGVTGLDRLDVAQQLADLEEDIAAFEADPTRTDFVKVSYDAWVLEKAFIRAPFAENEVQRLNEYQTGTGPGMPFHPFTCGNRGDGHHGTEGGDTGILIATEAGWVCPDCSYTQDWAHAMMVTPQNEVRLALSQNNALLKMMDQGKRDRLQSCLAHYRALAVIGKRGADIMVLCLERRREEMEASA